MPVQNLSITIAEADKAEKAKIIADLFKPKPSKSLIRNFETILDVREHETVAVVINTAYSALASSKKTNLRGYALAHSVDNDIRKLAKSRLDQCIAALVKQPTLYRKTLSLLDSKPRKYVIDAQRNVAPAPSVFKAVKNAVVSVAIYASMGVGMVYDFFAKMFDSSKPVVEPKTINAAAKTKELPVARAIPAEKGISPDCLDLSQFEGMHRDTVENFKRKLSGSELSDISSETARSSFSTATSLYNAAKQARSSEANRDRAMTL
ncbi:MAG: hypothetical protein K0R66_213 [Gammaproteobacteria bacterium]|jgi:hypothetical protein|nr:hypothetical protein [Gammaproteobacteria bacterium]